MEEFSLESLLCFIELSQYKNLLSSENVNKLNLPKEIPKSSIIYEYFERNQAKNDIVKDNMFIRKLKEISFEFYVKYIKSNSEFEINISYFMRMKYIEIMDNHDQWINYVPSDLESKNNMELFMNNLFDPIIEEMYSLMHGALNRFIFDNDEIVQFLHQKDINVAIGSV